MEQKHLQAIGEKKLYIFDMDGTIYLGGIVFDYAIRFIDSRPCGANPKVGETLETVLITNFETPDEATLSSYKYITTTSHPTLKLTFSNIMIVEGTWTEETFPISEYQPYGSSPSPTLPSPIINAGDTRILSREYQQVEYIESTGTQIIDTLFCPTNNTKVEIDVKFDVVTTPTNSEGAFGVYDGVNVFSTNFG
jgi:hypothetical protein